MSITFTVASARAEATNQRRYRTVLSYGACALALSLGAGGVALAQDDEPTASERIIVTGTRIQRSTAFNTPQPMTVFDSSDLDNLGIVNLGDAMVQVPANVSTFQPTATGNSNFFAGSTIANLRGLNPFFGSRTMTLIDTRRHVPTNQGDGVDLNFIPTVLIERVETVTGGASAAYGSGAISGVTNIILDRDMEGGRFEADYGETAQGDGSDTHAAAAYGIAFAEGRGHLVIGGEYQDMEAIGCAEARDWCASATGTWDNGAANFFSTGVAPYAPAVPGLPFSNLAEGLRQNQQHPNGVVLNTGLKINAAGTGTLPWEYGFPLSAAQGGFFDAAAFNVVGGEGDHVYRWTRLRTPVERYVANGLLSFELTPSIEATLEGSFGKVETLNVNSGSEVTDSTFGAGTIAADNAYVLQNPQLQSAFAMNALPSFFFTASPRTPFGLSWGYMAKDWTDQTGVSTTLFDTEVWRVAGGLQGDLDNVFGRSWAWDAYWQFGETTRTQFLTNLASNYRYQMAIDAVRQNPMDPNSPIVCRVTRDGVAAGLSPQVAGGYTSVIDELAQGCQPLNPFGTGPISQAAYDYAFGYLREDLTYSQQVVAGNVNGDLFDGFGAGPVQIALGAEYRREEGDNVAAEELTAARRADFPIQYGESFSGTVDVYELYGEVNLPLIADVPGFEMVELNGALRQSRYENESQSDFSAGATSEHDITTWKVSGTWDVTDWVRLRGSQSRDVRAPNLRELYYRQIIPAGGIFGSFQNPNLPNLGPFSQTDLTIIDLQGDVSLEPEEADTKTLGVVFTFGGLLEGLQFAADYYDIEINDSINQAFFFREIDGCFQNNIEEFCDNFIDVNGLPLTDPAANPLDISRIISTAYNAALYQTNGIDFSIDYTRELGGDRAISARLIATNMRKQFYDNGAGTSTEYLNQLGTTGFLSDFQPAPEWSGNLTLTYLQGPLSLTGQMRYVNEAKVDLQDTEPSDADFDPFLDNSRTKNTIAPYSVFNVSGSYNLLGGDFAGPGERSVQIWGSINNILDTDPDLFNGGFNGVAGTNPVFYDVVGRSYRIGIRTTF